jgi:hypothetical protein
MRRISTSLLLLLASSFAVAQTTPGSQPSNPGNLPTPTFTMGQIATNSRYLGISNFGCPVGFTASRQATGQIMSAGDAKQGPTQALHLTLDNRNTPAIESIEVKVYGTAQRGFYLPADQFTDTVSKTFQFHRTPNDTTLSEADVRMQLAGSLSRADLISITYADGTTWNATVNFQCRAVPSNFLLVGRK